MRNRIKFIIAVNLFAIIAGFTACKKTPFAENPPSSVSLYQMMIDDRNYSLFKAAVDRAGLKDLFNGGQELTVVIPRNEAMTNSGLGSIASIESLRRTFLDSLVKNHVIPGKLDITTINGTTEVQTLNQKLVMTKKGTQVYANGIDIVNYNKVATNGLLNASYRVLSDPFLSIYDWTAKVEAVNNNVNTSFLAAAIDRASQGTTNFKALLSGSGSLTLFAPTNQAFIDAGYANVAAVTAASTATLTTLLNNHTFNERKFTSDLDSVPVVNRAGLPVYFDRRVLNAGPFLYTANYANGIIFNPTNTNAAVGAVAVANIFAKNGIMHLIARFLPNPAPNPTTATNNNPLTVNTFQRINTDANLTYLKAALVRANEITQGGAGERFDFAALLSDPNQSYTIFAPDNAAFQAAGYSTIAAINAAQPKILIDLLKYHIARYRHNSINFVANSSIASLYELSNATTGAKIPTSILINTRTNTAYTVWGEGDATAATVGVKDLVTTNGLINIINKILTPRTP